MPNITSVLAHLVAIHILPVGIFQHFGMLEISMRMAAQHNVDIARGRHQFRVVQTVDIPPQMGRPYVILERKGVKVGVFGLGTQLEGMVASENYKGVSTMSI